MHHEKAVVFKLISLGASGFLLKYVGQEELHEAIEKVFKNYSPKKVVNLAAQAGVRYSIENPSSYIQSNLVGFSYILDGMNAERILIGSESIGDSRFFLDLATRLVILAIAAVSVVTWICLRHSGLLLRVLGVNGMNAITRIMGFLLICIAIQMMITGAEQLLHSWGFISAGAHDAPGTSLDAWSTNVSNGAVVARRRDGAATRHR